jgi:hypothetical protein
VEAASQTPSVEAASQTSSAEATSSTASKFNPTVANALAPAFYTKVVESADAARARAQNAYAVASAVAVALIGSAILGNLDQQPSWVQALGAAAVVAWVVVAGLFVVAIAVGTPKESEPDEVVGADAFVNRIIARAGSELGTIQKRTQRAMIGAAVAVLITVAALGGVVFHPPDLRSGEILVTTAEAHALQHVCPNVTNEISGEIDVASLDSEFVAIEPPASVCAGVSRVLRVDRGAILEEGLDDVWPVPPT